MGTAVWDFIMISGRSHTHQPLQFWRAIFNLSLCSKRDSLQRKEKSADGEDQLHLWSLPVLKQAEDAVYVLWAHVNQTDTWHSICECLLQTLDICIKLTWALLLTNPPHCYTCKFVMFSQAFMNCLPLSVCKWMKFVNMDRIMQWTSLLLGSYALCKQHPVVQTKIISETRRPSPYCFCLVFLCVFAASIRLCILTMTAHQQLQQNGFFFYFSGSIWLNLESEHIAAQMYFSLSISEWIHHYSKTIQLVGWVTLHLIILLSNSLQFLQ